jgi:hypothetical protein
MIKNGRAAGKAYESPVADAIDIEPFDVILYPAGNNEDIIPGEDDGEW